MTNQEIVTKILKFASENSLSRLADIVELIADNIKPNRSGLDEIKKTLHQLSIQIRDIA